MSDTAQRVAVVTGAGTGIGAATSLALASEGVLVYGLGPEEAPLSTTQRVIGQRARRGCFVPVVGDVTNDGDVRRLLETIARVHDGRLDVLVNNAAVFLLAGVDATDQQWQRTLEVNLLAPARLVSAALPLLQRSSHPAVVNVASISAHVAQSNRWTYNSAKAGVLELTRCQAIDLAPYGVRVNSVSPGWVWTEALDQAAASDRETWEPVWGAFSMQGRCGEPHEVAAAIRFLASPEASFITGVDLPVDGGYLAMGPEGATKIALER